MVAGRVEADQAEVDAPAGMASSVAAVAGSGAMGGCDVYWSTATCACWFYT
ncbi:hypothetical protein [Acidiphilium sp.]|uniref:hypothetical protein n=1 Tax=Acidiphilium sp. TaxID=527 RepID=UPI003D059F1D